MSLHNSTRETSKWIFLLGQAKKSARGMPWHQEPMKDVISCDKLRGAANKRLIRRFLNGETHMESCPCNIC